MATVNLGAIKFNWKGAYNNSTQYQVDDVVSSGGSSYICILASQGNAVSNGTYWSLMAQAGTDGTDVAATITTQGDLLYRDASGPQRLAAGTSGQFLKTLGTGANPAWGDVTSAIRKLTMFNDATYNITTSNSSVSFPITIDFVKAQADSDLFIQGWTPVDTQNSYRVGERMRIQKTSDSSYDSPSDGEAYGGNNFASPPASQGTDGGKGEISWSRRIDTSSETFFNSAETYRIHLGWSSRDGSAQRPGDTWNPQNTSSRARQSTTNIWVWELDPSTTAFLT
tara:strand:- start:2391 stop:3236 length:846 start_codon:yes stop_codon:yes gene_type:complete